MEGQANPSTQLVLALRDGSSQDFFDIAYAAKEGGAQLTTVLAGRSVDLCDNDAGMTALHYACTEGGAAIDVLLAAGASVNAQDNLGMAPLHYAAAAGPDGDGGTTVDKLVVGGANLSATGRAAAPPRRRAFRGPAPWCPAPALPVPFPAHAATRGRSQRHVTAPRPWRPRRKVRRDSSRPRPPTRGDRHRGPWLRRRARSRVARPPFFPILYPMLYPIPTACCLAGSPGDARWSWPVFAWRLCRISPAPATPRSC